MTLGYLTGTELFADVQDGVTKYTTLNEIYGFVTGSAPGLGGSGLGWARYDDTQYIIDRGFNGQQGTGFFLYLQLPE